MTALMLTRRGRSAASGEEPPALFDAWGGGPTLEDVISGVWEGLAAHASVTCPVCAGELRPQYSAGAGVVGGRCRDCGSELS